MEHERVREDRRAQKRLTLAGIESITARVRPGCTLTLVDWSRSGALVESERSFRPGAILDVHMTDAQGQICLRGRVVRCSVSMLGPGRMSYRSAIAFDTPHPWFTKAEAAYPVHAAQILDSRPDEEQLPADRTGSPRMLQNRSIISGLRDGIPFG